MGTQFTPGPWVAKVQPGQIVGKHTFTHEVVTPSECIATLLRAPDAHLIAAAPSLYAACEAARPLLQLAAANVPCRITAGRFQQAIDTMDAALAAARGEVQPWANTPT